MDNDPNKESSHIPTQLRALANDTMASTCAYASDLRRAAEKIEKLEAALREHDKWQNDAEGIYMEYQENGETKRLDITGEYGDSTMYENTQAALRGL